MSEEAIVIDPMGMNITNRVAYGTRISGTVECEGGLLIQGRIDGVVTVNGGPLVLFPEGVMSGHIACSHDAYLFGTVEEKHDGSLSEIDSMGTVFMTETLRAKSDITAASFKTYEGAQVDGRIKTAKKVRQAA